jgi:hypothetical protein
MMHAIVLSEAMLYVTATNSHDALELSAKQYVADQVRQPNLHSEFQVDCTCSSGDNVWAESDSLDCCYRTTAKVSYSNIPIPESFWDYIPEIACHSLGLRHSLRVILASEYLVAVGYIVLNQDA